MKIIGNLMIFVLVGLIFIQGFSFGTSTEDLQMKVKEPSSFRPSSSEMCDMLEKANLENRGFQKEVVRKSFQKPGRTRSDFETVYNYEKVVNCSVGAIEKMGVELNTSLPGAFGNGNVLLDNKRSKRQAFRQEWECVQWDWKLILGEARAVMREAMNKNFKKRIRRLFAFSIKASIRLKLQGVVFRVPRVNYTGIPFL
ncbi:uncharacterized protein LOC111327867 [Stylophora pistillata]|uniref:uncharacterized protein LOC111327867 n=1 Tax=Stylophora pistillata TaxID=50429 RepID=UPI000C04A3D7|nr:uncharacterized protein LOC111327867 [Stylophora pistillata]